MMDQRASLGIEMQSLQKILPDVLKRLQQDPQWYCSVFVERKLSKRFSADLRETQITESLNWGGVLRIYDGWTLHEQATDQWDEAALAPLIDEFIARVNRARRFHQGEPKLYQAPTWKQRLARPLDVEITKQISKGVTAEQWVHFGVRFKTHPDTLGTPQIFVQLKSKIELIKKFATEAGINDESHLFIEVSTLIRKEESLFIDAESRLSQAFYRVYIAPRVIWGEDQVHLRDGGLGGVELIALEDEALKNMIFDLKNLRQADRMQPGHYRVLLGPEVTGVLAHEAFGHSQEGDTCARGRSKAWDLFHSKTPVGNEHATILNNPAIYHNGLTDSAAWGSYFFDEEGWLAESQVLLDQGVLCAPMTNLTSAIRLNVPRTANGKRESWANGVYTRQTNTYFSAGSKTYTELLGMIESGFVADIPYGGMEDPKAMGIQVGIQFLREVKNGKLTGKLLKGPAGGSIQMTGYTPDILNNILDKSKIDHLSEGPDEAQHPFNDVGGCGKYHKETVFAGCGGPYMLVDQVLLG